MANLSNRAAEASSSQKSQLRDHRENRQPSERSTLRARSLDLRCACRIGYFQLGESLLQSNDVKLVDGERSDAALRASQFADQPLAAAACRIGQCRVDNLHQFLIAGWKRDAHGKRITQVRATKILGDAYLPPDKEFAEKLGTAGSQI